MKAAAPVATAPAIAAAPAPTAVDEPEPAPAAAPVAAAPAPVAVVKTNASAKPAGGYGSLSDELPGRGGAAAAAAAGAVGGSASEQDVAIAIGRGGGGFGDAVRSPAELHPTQKLPPPVPHRTEEYVGAQSRPVTVGYAVLLVVAWIGVCVALGAPLHSVTRIGDSNGPAVRCTLSSMSYSCSEPSDSARYSSGCASWGSTGVFPNWATACNECSKGSSAVAALGAFGFLTLLLNVVLVLMRLFNKVCASALALHSHAGRVPCHVL